MRFAAARRFCAHAYKSSSGDFQQLHQLWHRNGVVWPIEVLPTSDAHSLGKSLLNEVGDPSHFKDNELMYYKSHLVFSVVDKLARHPGILARVSKILGSSDVLLWDSSIPIKPPVAEGFLSVAPGCYLLGT